MTPTIPAAHDLKPKVDAILEVMRQQADEPSRHHPVQSTLCHPLVIAVTLKNLEGKQHFLIFLLSKRISKSVVPGRGLTLALGLASVTSSLYVYHCAPSRLNWR